MCLKGVYQIDSGSEVSAEHFAPTVHTHTYIYIHNYIYLCMYLYICLKDMHVINKE